MNVHMPVPTHEESFFTVLNSPSMVLPRKTILLIQSWLLIILVKVSCQFPYISITTTCPCKYQA